VCETFTQRRIITAIPGAGSSATPLFFKRIILLAEQLLYALTKRHRGGAAPIMLNNSLIPARTEDIAERVF